MAPGERVKMAPQTGGGGGEGIKMPQEVKIRPYTPNLTRLSFSAENVLAAISPYTLLKGCAQGTCPYTL